MTQDERQTMIAAIREAPAAFREVTAGLGATQLDTPYREGGWTVRQVIHHLADSHMHAYLRMKFMATADRFTIQPYNQDVWAGLPDARGGALDTSLALLEGLHARWAEFLRALPEEAWKRSAQHPERGTVTMESMLKIYAGHGEKHVGQIRGLRNARGW